MAIKYVMVSWAITTRVRNDIVSFWFGGNISDMGTELQAPVKRVRGLKQPGFLSTLLYEPSVNVIKY